MSEQKIQEMSRQFQAKIQEIMSKTANDPSANGTIEHLQHQIESIKVQAQTELETARTAAKAHYDKIEELEKRNVLAMNQASHLNKMNNIAGRRIGGLEHNVPFFWRDAFQGLGGKV